ncbi:AbrB/MazE/SpoVT family DNA-binding domain-containing protein [Mechercharimyces sp. CAU 1602]|uniref:AbrB/MazE/SpoVT family DNA-binding domain-containing protein n=1 Tax=Mechercharimyces sp. CAU 1602 TaxID=2973933 RepID=UPI0021633AE5|nr:AbrB/MazE/SpoVT family DNA-binding domain-containing protein [Mechercharimyces sp. CAU 1602]MCS1351911.1 AbrB/MazE/SpoVT family DNA-binding domain-containing protein [Mechercharimyces sp. CAU 1602]
MKGVGIVRKVDHLGRVVLPKELRRSMNISAHDGFEVFIKGDEAIVLQKYSPSCVFCEGMEEVIFYRDRLVCKSCIQEAKNEVS